MCSYLGYVVSSFFRILYIDANNSLHIRKINYSRSELGLCYEIDISFGVLNLTVNINEVVFDNTSLNRNELENIVMSDALHSLKDYFDKKLTTSIPEFPNDLEQLKEDFTYGY